MFRWLNSRRGQNTAEYAILIGVIVAAAIAMQVYIRRGLQARVKVGVDYTAQASKDATDTALNFETTGQYEPYYLQTNMETTQSGKTEEALQAGLGVARHSLTDTTTRIGNQIYGNYTSWNTTN